MDEKSLPGLFSQLIPDEIETSLGLGGKNADEQDSILAGSLKIAAGQSGGALVTAVNEFLNGQGALHETTRSAVTRGGNTATKEIASLLEKQFNVAPATAQIMAALLVKLFPSIAKGGKQESTTKKKPRKKTKPKTATAAKKETGSTKKKPKKKTPKTSATKPAARPAAKKKKTPAKPAKKDAKPAKKPKKATRTLEIGGQSESDPGT